MDVTSSRWRPKQEEAAAITGWQTADVRRYDVPVQNVSAADPRSERDISCVRYVSGRDQTEPQLRGSLLATPSPGW
jgi:hypothetical protein